MYRSRSNLFQCELVTIYPGEVYVTRTGEAISTVLGSCISVCLLDRITKVGGMNHFMLPAAHPLATPSIENLTAPFFYHDSYRYGTTSMEVLIGEMQKAGAERSRLRAKVFGGGNVLQLSNGVIDVGGKNIRFIHTYLQAEGIPLEKEDVGGFYGRKIFFFPFEDRVLMKPVKDDETAQVAREEQSYERSIGTKPSSGSVDLF